MWIGNLVFGGKEKISNLQRQLLRLEIGAVAEYDHAQAIAIGEALNHGTKTHRASRMPHSLSPLIGIKKPAEAIRNRLARMKVVVVGLCWPVRLGAVVESTGSYSRLQYFSAPQ